MRRREGRSDEEAGRATLERAAARRVPERLAGAIVGLEAATVNKKKPFARTWPRTSRPVHVLLTLALSALLLCITGRMQEPKAGRRIVSKGEYVLRRAFQGGLAFSCTCAVGVAMLSGLATIIALIIAACEAFNAIAACETVYALQQHSIEQVLDGVLKCLGRVLVLGGVCWLSWRLALAAATKSKENVVVPLTRANTADLHAPDSLVRASQEPMQAQKGVLLRAATQASEQQEEHLVRASVGGEQA